MKVVACIVLSIITRTLAGEPGYSLQVPAYAAAPIYHAEPPQIYQPSPSFSYTTHALHSAPAPILKAFEPAPIYKTFEAAPILKTYAPAPILKTFEPAPILKTFEPAPVLKYAAAPVAAAPVAVKTPVATSYQTITTSHVTHPVAKVATPIVKYAAAPVVKYEAPVVKYAPAPIVKYAAAPVVETAPFLKYAATAPAYNLHSEPAVGFKALASPLFSYSHEAPSVEYAPSYGHGLDSLDYH